MVKRRYGAKLKVKMSMEALRGQKEIGHIAPGLQRATDQAVVMEEAIFGTQV